MRPLVLAVALVLACAGCETDDVDLSRSCTCGPELAQLSEDCLAAATAAEVAAEQAARDGDQVVKSEVERQLFEFRDLVLAQLDDLRFRVEALEAAP